MTGAVTPIASTARGGQFAMAADSVAMRHGTGVGRPVREDPFDTWLAAHIGPGWGRDRRWIPMS